MENSPSLLFWKHYKLIYLIQSLKCSIDSCWPCVTTYISIYYTMQCLNKWKEKSAPKIKMHPSTSVIPSYSNTHKNLSFAGLLKFSFLFRATSTITICIFKPFFSKVLDKVTRHLMSYTECRFKFLCIVQYLFDSSPFKMNFNFKMIYITKEWVRRESISSREKKHFAVLKIIIWTF